MDFGTCGSFKLLPFNKKRHGALYGKMTRTHVTLMAKRVPTSLQTWAEESSRFKTELGLRDANYEMRWLFRAVMIAEMRAMNIKSVTVDAADKKSLMQECFPDQCGWLQNSASSHGTIKKTMQMWNYNGPAELFTMFLCILCTCTTKNAEDIQKHKKAIMMRRHELDEPGRHAHPAIVLDVC